MLGLTGFDPDSPGLALGTRQGVVKRVNPELPRQPRRLGRHLPQGRRRGRRRGRAAHRRGDALLREQRRASCCTSPPTGSVPRGARAAASPASSSRRAPGWSRSPRSTPTPRSSCRSRAPARRCPGTEAGSVKVTPFSEYPAQGPRDRRRPLPPLPQGRGRAGLRLGRRRSRPGGRRQRCAGRPARADHPSRRLRGPRQPAHRRVRRSGGAPRSLGRTTPTSPPTWQADRMAHPRRARVRPLLAAVLVPLVVLAGCGGGGGGDKAEEPTPAEVMATAKKNFDDASSVRDRPVHGLDAHLGQRRPRRDRRGHPRAGLRGRRQGGPQRAHRDRADHLGGRQGLRQAAAADEVHRDRPHRVRRPRPGRVRRPGQRSLLPADPARRPEEGQGDAQRRGDPDLLLRRRSPAQR